jgi:beta-aspartyl-peptidase (threonine type)
LDNIAFAVHGGASENYDFLKENYEECKEGLAAAAKAGYKILKSGGAALDAVENAVMLLEDNPLFNAGKGSALNSKGEVEMDASIMDGSNLNAGAVSMVRTVKNPIALARVIMEKTRHVFFSGYGALEIANLQNLHLEPESYFITDQQYKTYEALHKVETTEDLLAKKIMGTVGAVALDKKGNLAAGTSTGGTSNCLPGRIGDTCVIGSGCYANNQICAVSGTGEGEFLITGVVANTIAMYVELGKMTIQEACDYVIHTRNLHRRGEMGVIAVTPKGEIGISFNTEIMKRAFINNTGKLTIAI